MGRANCLLVDRGGFMIDAILQVSDWIIELLVVDSPDIKNKYLNCQRIKQIYTMKELLDADDVYGLQYETIRLYKSVQSLADAGFRRIYDDYQLSRYDFYTSISFWNHYFDNNCINVCIIVGLLHGLKCDAIVQQIALQRNIPTFVVSHSFFGFRTVFDCFKEKLIEKDKFHGSKMDFTLSQHYLKRYNYDDNFGNQKSEGMIIDLKRAIANGAYSLFGIVGVRLLWRMRHPNYVYAPNYVRHSVIDIISASVTRWFIQRYYEAHSVEPDYTQPYVVYYLQLEPEAAVQGNADVVDSQLVMIKLLAESIPLGWKVYVANHPDAERLNHAIYECHIIPYVTFQSKLFYSKLISMKNVYLLTRQVNRKRLFENARAVATISGTVALEAVELRKPVLLFGASKTVYRYCSDFFHIDSLRSCQEALCRIAEGFVPAYQDFEQQCQRYLFPETGEGWNGMVQAIMEYIE